MSVSLRFSLLWSMIGSRGSGTVRNLTGRPVLVSFQRSVNDTLLSAGSVAPSRRLTAFWVLLSFWNCPLDSRCEAARA